MAKEKVFLSEKEKKKSSSTLTERYGVSRATIHRAKKRGWFWKGYHERGVFLDLDWVSNYLEEIEEDAATGARLAVGRIMNLTCKNGADICHPLSVPDLINEAKLRLIELSGHERRDDKGWRINVARNTASDVLKKIWGEIRKSNKIREKFESEFLLTSEETESLKAVLSILPEKILLIGEKITKGELISEEETLILEKFRAL